MTGSWMKPVIVAVAAVLVAAMLALAVVVMLWGPPDPWNNSGPRDVFGVPDCCLGGER